MARVAPLLCLLAATAASGCGSDRATRGEGTLRVVATTAPLADVVRNAGGRRVVVTALVPRGADPHSWRPRPADLGILGAADLVVRSGGPLDAWAAGLAERELAVMPRIRPLGDDVHWWLDPVRVQRAVKEIRNELARADVDGAGFYEAATADFLARLRRLDRQIRRCLSSAAVRRSPERLAAQHRAFAYFTDRYGVRFFPPRRATVGRRLWTDTLGRPGSASESYLGAMAVNTKQIVDALSGGSERCRPRP